MKLEEIKSVIIKRLNEIKKMSSEYSDGSDYDNLQDMIKKTIVAVTEVESAAEIESIAIYLEAIEDYYNKCKSEIIGSDSDEQLFDFSFEIDDEDTACDPKDSPDEEDEYDPQDIRSKVLEIEDNYDRIVDRCPFLEKSKLKSLRRKSIEAVRSAKTEIELIEATRAYKRDFKNFTTRLERIEAYNKAKLNYDEKNSGSSGKNANILRLLFGFGGLIGGAAYGFVEGWSTLPKWPIAIMGAGISFVLLALMYLAADSRRSAKTKRRMAFLRIVLAAIFLIGSIIAGIILSDFGILVMLAATFPFTLGGAWAYGFYRIKLYFLTQKVLKKQSQ